MSTTAGSPTSQATSGTADGIVYQEQIVTRLGVRRILAVSRIVIGFTFLWAFIDKLFGLGFATPSERAWINGGTPAQGFIGGIEGPFADFFQLFANPFGDVLFMAGLLGIGVAVMAGAGLKIAAVTGTLLMLFMYLAELPPVLGGTNPIVDSHWHEALLLIIAAATLSGDTWGVGKIWARIVGNGWLR
ncbi:DoxX family protein [Cellulomonas fengjieae]|uniref:DoxX family protein n=1 Tax=Cellulomonas fengjieae TaxID=2819978 RepID=A0ABS3SJ58_9CELL|nr:DoxX family protein [Cellulomonas fengjieae]MBO3085788.1 DoxX family protein [Cellulomonas fengjieae]MBO3102898.1 DoxX family protein [Cellulomonas fengjieae]QVI67508.1 DoxX family protein [Cellulomonas fengjieae]